MGSVAASGEPMRAAFHIDKAAGEDDKRIKPFKPVIKGISPTPGQATMKDFIIPN